MMTSCENDLLQLCKCFTESISGHRRTALHIIEKRIKFCCCCCSELMSKKAN